MGNWNLIVTTAEGRYTQALGFLARFGVVKPTSYYNVVMMQVYDIPALMGSLAQEWERQGGRLLLLQRVVPMSHTFNFRDQQVFGIRATEIASGWTEQLAGKTFHVRMHRRGFKDQLRSEEEERLLNAAIVDATTPSGKPAVVSFDNPDAIIAVETIGNQAGMSLWFREDLQRYPFLHIR
jgi:tRNA(Ser,Leu) C12 N-acetylase TAN1